MPIRQSGSYVHVAGCIAKYPHNVKSASLWWNSGTAVSAAGECRLTARITRDGSWPKPCVYPRLPEHNLVQRSPPSQLSTLNVRPEVSRLARYTRNENLHPRPRERLDIRVETDNERLAGRGSSGLPDRARRTSGSEWPHPGSQVWIRLDLRYGTAAATYRRRMRQQPPFPCMRRSDRREGWEETEHQGSVHSVPGTGPGCGAPLAMRAHRSLAVQSTVRGRALVARKV